MINSEQIRFDQKGWVEVEEGLLSKVRALICPEENSTDRIAICLLLLGVEFMLLTLESEQGWYY